MEILEHIDMYIEGWNEPKGKLAGWIAMYNGKKLEIKKSEAKDLWGAKQLVIKKT